MSRPPRRLAPTANVKQTAPPHTVPVNLHEQHFGVYFTLPYLIFDLGTVFGPRSPETWKDPDAPSREHEP